MYNCNTMVEGKKVQTIATYDKAAPDLAWKFNMIGVRDEDIDRLFSYLTAQDPAILEIGCGNGRDGKEIARRTPHYRGIDISRRMIDFAQSQVSDAQFEVADAETYEYPAGLDAIVSFASLLHSDKAAIRSLFERAHAALKPGGIFYISLKKGAYEEGGTLKQDEFGSRTFFYYTPKEIQEIAGDLYDTKHVEEKNIRDVDWFTIVLARK